MFHSGKYRYFRIRGTTKTKKAAKSQYATKLSTPTSIDN